MGDSEAFASEIKGQSQAALTLSVLSLIHHGLPHYHDIIYGRWYLVGMSAIGNTTRINKSGRFGADTAAMGGVVLRSRIPCSKVPRGHHWGYATPSGRSQHHRVVRVPCLSDDDRLKARPLGKRPR